MLKRCVKLSASAVMLVMLSFSSNSFAGDVYGKVGYGHYPFKVVIGYNHHDRHHGYKHYKHKRHHKKHYYVPRHYRHHSYYDRHRGHYYKPSKRYCRSRY